MIHLFLLFAKDTFSFHSHPGAWDLGGLGGPGPPLGKNRSLAPVHIIFLIHQLSALLSVQLSARLSDASQSD